MASKEPAAIFVEKSVLPAELRMEDVFLTVTLHEFIEAGGTIGAANCPDSVHVVGVVEVGETQTTVKVLRCTRGSGQLEGSEQVLTIPNDRELPIGRFVAELSPGGQA